MAGLDAAVFITVAAAVACWSAGEALRSRAFWTAGALLMLAHAVLAFGVFYEWSHAVARDLTMRQTAALTGLQFAGGIYINYLFLIVWLGDAVWWWLSPRTHAGRPVWASTAIRGFVFFMMLNGAVVFADGWARVLGVSAVALVTARAAARYTRR